MKIDPPDGFKIPQKPAPRKPDQVSGPQSSEFQGKIDVTRAAGQADETKRSEGISRPQSTPSGELRELLRDLDPQDPEHLQMATDRVIDWVLGESFGGGVLKAKGADSLRAAIRDQILNDPNEAARLQSILERL